MTEQQELALPPNNELREAAIAYGELRHAVHIGSYSFEQAFNSLKWLLQNGRWCELGYTNPKDFISSIRFDEYKILTEQRQEIVKLIKAAEPTVSNRAIAKMVGADETSIRRDTAVNAALTKQYNNEINDNVTVAAANAAPPAVTGPEAAKAVAGFAQRQQRKEEIKERKSNLAKLAASVPPASIRHEVYNDSCEAVLDRKECFADFVITDPPYPKEHLPLYDLLGRVAAHALKPGGSLLCMTGQTYLPDVVNSLVAHLNYHWTLAYLTPGGQSVQIFPRHINTFWKPILWFVKETFTGEWIGDVTKSDVNDNDKRFHEWGQSESGMRDLMSRFVTPGQTVLDPFMGAGTTGVVALSLRAHFVGFDQDKDAFNESVVRLEDAKLHI